MKIQISPYTYLFYALLLLVNHDRSIVAEIAAVFIHETGHLLVISLGGCKVDGVTITPIGLTIKRTGLTGHRQDVAIHLAGPFTNLSTALILTVMGCDIDSLPVSANLFFALLNLLPITPLDGGKALSSLLSLIFSHRVCQSVCRYLSYGCLFMLWLFAAAELLMLDGSPSLLLFCIGLFISQISPMSD